MSDDRAAQVAGLAHAIMNVPDVKVIYTDQVHNPHPAVWLAEHLAPRLGASPVAAEPTVSIPNGASSSLTVGAAEPTEAMIVAHDCHGTLQPYSPDLCSMCGPREPVGVMTLPELVEAFNALRAALAAQGGAP